MGHAQDGQRRPAHPLPAAEASVIAETLQGLAASSRLQILTVLRHGPMSVGALADAVGMEASTVSQQLRVLRNLGFVVGTRQGKHVHYALHDSHVAQLIDEAIFHVEHLRQGRGAVTATDAALDAP